MMNRKNFHDFSKCFQIDFLCQIFLLLWLKFQIVLSALHIFRFHTFCSVIFVLCRLWWWFYQTTKNLGEDGFGRWVAHLWCCIEYSPVSVAMAGCSEGGTVSGRVRALNVSNPAHSNRAPRVAATVMPSTQLRTRTSF